MKKIVSFKKGFLILLLGIVLLSSCKLDVVPLDRYTDITVWQSETNAKLYLYDQYAAFNTFSFGRFPIGYSNATDALTDLMKFTSTASGNGTVNMLAFNPSLITISDPGFAYWTEAYQRIYAVNNFLYGIEKYGTFKDSATDKAYQAEARFIRGYIYFWLLKLHGSVVLLDEPVTTNKNPRSSEDDCWNFVARDFAFAAQYLPETRPAADLGRATKGAAYALLARTWLYAASIAQYDNKQFNSDPLTGVPAAKKDVYYLQAADAATAVMALETKGVYSLQANFSNAFHVKNNNEVIFAFNYIRPSITSTIDRDYSPPADQSSYGSMGVPTAELVDEFEMADGTKFSWNDPLEAANPYKGRESRFYATVLYNGATWKGRTLNTATGNEGYVEYGSQTEPKKTVTGYYTRKYLDSTNLAAVQNGSDQQSIEIRYAEVLLIYAEAMAQLGHLSEAKTALDRIRQRAGLPGTTATDLPGMMDAIEHERKVELAFEGHRYWDLRRWRKAHIVLNNVRFHGHKPVAAGAGFTYQVVDCDKQDRYFAPITYYIPFPVAEISNNPVLKQIQGW